MLEPFPTAVVDHLPVPGGIPLSLQNPAQGCFTPSRSSLQVPRKKGSPPAGGGGPSGSRVPPHQALLVC